MHNSPLLRQEALLRVGEDLCVPDWSTSLKPALLKNQRKHKGTACVRAGKHLWEGDADAENQRDSMQILPQGRGFPERSSENNWKTERLDHADNPGTTLLYAQFAD